MTGNNEGSPYIVDADQGKPTAINLAKVLHPLWGRPSVHRILGATHGRTPTPEGAYARG